MRVDDGSTGDAASPSVDEMTDIYMKSPSSAAENIPAMYEFEIPQSLVGLVIGIKGQTVKEISTLSHTTMIIRRDHPSCKPGFQVCTVEGKRSNVNLCLQMLRRKFPAKRFPELNLSPLIPVPTQQMSSPLVHTSMLSLPEGVAVEVAVCNVQSPSHFFLNQPTHPTFSALSTLDDCMAQVYRQPTGVPGLTRPIEVGVLCVAPMELPPWKGWYRAVTCAYSPDNDNVLIKYIDYGGYANVAADTLKQIRSDFTTLPFQATECYLANVTPIPPHHNAGPCEDLTAMNHWSKDAFAYFIRVATEKIVEATVVSYCPDDGKPMVKLDTLIDGKHYDVAQLMIEQGYATFRETPSPSSGASAAPSPS